jgi:hypothetical protein
VLLEKTGITTTTNYSYLYKPIVWLFGQWFEDGTSYDKPGMTENLKNSFEEFLKSGPLTAINASHNMISNQDKPRPLHLLSLNVKLFTKGNPDASDMGVVVDVVGAENKNNILSSKAIAVGQIFNRYFDGNNDIPEDTKKYLRRAVAILALGKTTESKDEKTDFMRADTFGAKDFSITLNDVAKKAVEVAKKEGKELTFKEDSSDLNLAESANREIFVDRAYEKITETARGKFAKIWKMYIGLGGNPSLFNGDEYAQTGFESPAKNHHGSNREIVNHDVVKNPRRADTAEYNREIKAVNELHKHKELSALADGTPSSLGLLIDNRGTRVGHTVYKNNDKGSEVLTVNTTVGMVSDWFEQISKNPAPIYLDKLHLGLKGGLTVGTRFKKLSYDKDKGEYVTAQDKYYLNEGNSPEPKYFGTEEEYVVKCNQGGDKYYLERIVHDKDGYHHSKEVELDDSTVIFYKPKAEGNSGTISFKGNPHVSLANLKYNIPV